MSKLRETRVVKGLTQFDLRMRTGIHPTKISHFEHGYLSPSETEQVKLARALGVRIEDLFPDQEAK